jgi:hypothetical protein|tara:strand:- start:917 stop:1033 length:117 start_codon:yes stop_codon:yes gene_type:complete
MIDASPQIGRVVIMGKMVLKNDPLKDVMVITSPDGDRG